jgi:hypothetical protein
MKKIILGCLTAMIINTNLTASSMDGGHISINVKDPDRKVVHRLGLRSTYEEIFEEAHNPDSDAVKVEILSGEGEGEVTIIKRDEEFFITPIPADILFRMISGEILVSIINSKEEGLGAAAASRGAPAANYARSPIHVKDPDRKVGLRLRLNSTFEEIFERVHNSDSDAVKVEILSGEGKGEVTIIKRDEEFFTTPIPADILIGMIRGEISVSIINSKKEGLGAAAASRGESAAAASRGESAAAASRGGAAASEAARRFPATAPFTALYKYENPKQSKFRFSVQIPARVVDDLKSKGIMFIRFFMNRDLKENALGFITTADINTLGEINYIKYNIPLEAGIVGESLDIYYQLSDGEGETIGPVHLAVSAQIYDYDERNYISAISARPWKDGFTVSSTSDDTQTLTVFPGRTTYRDLSNQAWSYYQNKENERVKYHNRSIDINGKSLAMETIRDLVTEDDIALIRTGNFKFRAVDYA